MTRAVDLPAIRVERVSFRMKRPQLWRDDWRNADVVITYTGACVSCGRTTYERSDGQNDPRGVLSDHASHALSAEDYDATGPDVPLCAICGNEEGPYTYALQRARRRWKEKADA